jgi:hypothetical protein
MKISHTGALGIPLAYFRLQGGQAAMMNLVRQMRGTLSLNDLLVIMSIALSIPLRLAIPLAVEIVSRRINIRLT